MLVSVSNFCISTHSSFSGHGTIADPMNRDQLIATVTGFVERVSKLVSVRSLYSRYTGDIGDVVVGRVVDVGEKRWKLDLGGRTHGQLPLSSVNLPGGIQVSFPELFYLSLKDSFSHISEEKNR